MRLPKIAVGSAEEYRDGVERARRYLLEYCIDPGELVRVNARYDYRRNRIVLYGLPEPSDELSAAETLSHEMLHALLAQLGEADAARRVDLVSKPVGDPARAGGL